MAGVGLGPGEGPIEFEVVVDGGGGEGGVWGEGAGGLLGVGDHVAEGEEAVGWWGDGEVGGEEVGFYCVAHGGKGGREL